jgi:thioredoxin reductase (NADPH)
MFLGLVIMNYELGIIGAGPAGYAAAIYAERAGVKTVVFDKGMGGGLAAISPNIENYTGFESISGFELVEKMKAHASKYAELKFGEQVEDILLKDNIFTVKTSKNKYYVKAVLLCTGTEYRKLAVSGEKEFSGKGVSYCATCDGFFFKGKNVAVVGGGNSALIEAIYLKQIGCSQVYLIHRRDMLRAEKAYENEAKGKGVVFLFNKIVESINGKEKVGNLSLKDTKTDEASKLEVDGVFVSIGEIPQNKLAEKLGVKLDDKGFIIVDRQGRTNVKGVYAAGDITGGLRQVITACAEGAIAALASTESVGKKYPY